MNWQTSGRCGSIGGLPNSRMSAPAMNVRPSQIITIAETSASAMPFAMPALMPARTACDKAFTGGLLTVMTPTDPSFANVTTSAIFLSPYVFLLYGEKNGFAAAGASARPVNTFIIKILWINCPAAAPAPHTIPFVGLYYFIRGAANTVPGARQGFQGAGARVREAPARLKCLHCGRQRPAALRGAPPPAVRDVLILYTGKNKCI